MGAHESLPDRKREFSYLRYDIFSDETRVVASYSVAEAEHSLPSLIDKAASGETVVITRHGKPVAEIRAPSPEPSSPAPDHKAAADYEWLIARRDQRPGMDLTSVDLLNQLHDEP